MAENFSYFCQIWLSLNDTAMNRQVRSLLPFKNSCVLSCFAEVSQHAYTVLYQATHSVVPKNKILKFLLSLPRMQKARLISNLKFREQTRKGQKMSVWFSSFDKLPWQSEDDLNYGVAWGPRILKSTLGFSCLLLSSGSGVWPTVP